MVRTFRDGLEGLGVLELRPTPQVHEGGVMLWCTANSHEYQVFLDISDKSTFINREALAVSSLYFKCQFHVHGYGDPRIVHGGYPVASHTYYQFYKRRTPKRIDVLGRFGYTFNEDQRRRAVQLLAESNLNFVGGADVVRYSRFLMEAASARLCLELPGNGPFTYRVPEFLGLGSCMVSPVPTTELHRPIVPWVHYVPISDDLSDLVETCQYYLDNPVERERIARTGKVFFEDYLHCDQLAAFYVYTLLEHLRK